MNFVLFRRVAFALICYGLVAAPAWAQQNQFAFGAGSGSQGVSGLGGSILVDFLGTTQIDLDDVESDSGVALGLKWRLQPAYAIDLTFVDTDNGRTTPGGYEASVSSLAISIRAIAGAGSALEWFAKAGYAVHAIDFSNNVTVSGTAAGGSTITSAGPLIGVGFEWVVGPVSLEFGANRSFAEVGTASIGASTEVVENSVDSPVDQLSAILYFHFGGKAQPSRL